MKLLVFLLVFTFHSAGFALSSPHEQFRTYLNRVENKPVQQLHEKQIYNYAGDLVELEESLYEQLLSVAQSQASIWGDTILEGDVAALGEVQLLNVELLYDEREHYGYRISYGQRGWDTSNCDLSQATSEDYKREETFASCLAGTITESAYVTKDFKMYFADINALAEFTRSE